MASRYQGGAIVIEQPNPWAEALQGLGAGAGMIGQALLKKRDKAKDTMQDITVGTATGKYKPEFWATKEAEDFLRSAGVWNKPEIQGLVTRARAGMGYGAPPDVATQLPVAPGSPPAEAGVGGGVVNVPQPAPEPPDAKVVNEYLYKEDERKKLAVYEFQRKISSAETRLNAEHANDLRMGNIKSFAEQVDLTAKVLKQSGVEFDDIIWRGNAEAGLSWEINPLALKRLMEAQANKKGTSYTKFETTASTFNEKRMRHVSKLSTFLATDRVDSKALALDSNDPDTDYYLSAMAAINGEPDKNKRVALQVEQVEKIVKQLNENIKQYRRVIQSAGDEAKAEQLDITDRFTKEITFEDVSGGLSPEEYKKKKGLVPEPGKLISDVRSDYRGNSVTAPRFSDVSAKDAATKVSDTFKDIKETVTSALQDNPTLDSTQIKQVILQNKDQIMAEYGLNEKLFSLLMAMSDKVLG